MYTGAIYYCNARVCTRLFLAFGSSRARSQFDNVVEVFLNLNCSITFNNLHDMEACFISRGKRKDSWPPCPGLAKRARFDVSLDLQVTSDDSNTFKFFVDVGGTEIFTFECPKGAAPEIWERLVDACQTSLECGVCVHNRGAIIVTSKELVHFAISPLEDDSCGGWMGMSFAKSVCISAFKKAVTAYQTGTCQKESALTNLNSDTILRTCRDNLDWTNPIFCADFGDRISFNFICPPGSGGHPNIWEYLRDACASPQIGVLVWGGVCHPIGEARIISLSRRIQFVSGKSADSRRARMCVSFAKEVCTDAFNNAVTASRTGFCTTRPHGRLRWYGKPADGKTV